MDLCWINVGCEWWEPRKWPKRMWMCIVRWGWIDCIWAPSIHNKETLSTEHLSMLRPMFEKLTIEPIFTPLESISSWKYSQVNARICGENEIELENVLKLKNIGNSSSFSHKNCSRNRRISWIHQKAF